MNTDTVLNASHLSLHGLLCGIEGHQKGNELSASLGIDKTSNKTASYQLIASVMELVERKYELTDFSSLSTIEQLEGIERLFCDFTLNCDRDDLRADLLLQLVRRHSLSMDIYNYLLPRIVPIEFKLSLYSHGVL